MVPPTVPVGNSAKSMIVCPAPKPPNHTKPKPESGSVAGRDCQVFALTEAGRISTVALKMATGEKPPPSMSLSVGISRADRAAVLATAAAVASSAVL